jgi:hypothetical protein
MQKAHLKIIALVFLAVPALPSMSLVDEMPCTRVSKYPVCKATFAALHAGTLGDNGVSEGRAMFNGRAACDPSLIAIICPLTRPLV